MKTHLIAIFCLVSISLMGGYKRLYLVTDLTGFYEKCGWEYLGDAHELEAGAIRLYGTDTCS